MSRPKRCFDRGMLTRRTFRLEESLLEALDEGRRSLSLNRTEYLRRALRCALCSDLCMSGAERHLAALDRLLEDAGRSKLRKPNPNSHRLSSEDQLRGVKAALKSRRTPARLKKGLRKRAEDLEKQLEREASK